VLVNVEMLIRRHFADVPDPLPRWADVKTLLDAKRKGCEIHRYTFDEKRRFDPKVLAKQVFDQQMPPLAIQQFLQETWNQVPACGYVYRDNLHAFLEDVTREVTLLITPPPPPVEPEVEQLVPTETPRPWGRKQSGYDLAAIRDAVLAVKQNFPNGTPTLGGVRWMDRWSKRYFGFCRSSDNSIRINSALNSPDVPRFVLEFLMYHELLHAAMPYAGHNPEFRDRERRFVPSAEAMSEALRRGIRTANTTGAWRARADGFLDTFQKRWIIGNPGTTAVM
jgi:hypothetical protein